MVDYNGIKTENYNEEEFYESVEWYGVNGDNCSVALRYIQCDFIREDVKERLLDRLCRDSGYSIETLKFKVFSRQQREKLIESCMKTRTSAYALLRYYNELTTEQIDTIFSYILNSDNFICGICSLSYDLPVEKLELVMDWAMENKMIFDLSIFFKNSYYHPEKGEMCLQLRKKIIYWLLTLSEEDVVVFLKKVDKDFHKDEK